MQNKSSVLLNLFIVVLFAAVSLSAGTFIAESDEWNLHTYVIVEFVDATWDQADGDVNAVLNSHYHLATITSPEEQAFVAEFLDNNKLAGQFWIGGLQNPLDTQDAAANWEWVTGEAWAYTNWAENEGEPNDYYGPGSEQHLGIVSDRDWTWNDQDLINRWWINGYVAELSPLTPDIDIKPGSDPNCINLDSKGVVPVAVLGSSSFDVHDVDQTTVVFEGVPAKFKGKSGNIGAFEDVNGDSYIDLMLQFPTPDLDLSPDATEGTLFGRLLDGTPILGTDAVCIAPPSLNKNIAGNMIPTDFALAPNTPNPFNPSTRITYAIPEQSNVILSIYNVRGEKIVSLVTAVQPQGMYTILWNGTDDNGQLVPGGVYLARITAGSFTQSIRMVLLK